MKIQQVSVFIENKPGRLIEMIDVLASANINIRAMSIADTSDFGILRLIVDKPEESIKVLKELGCTASLTSVLGVGLKDEKGEFVKALRVLSDNKVDVEYMYTFISCSNKKAYVILRVSDEDKAIEAYNKSGHTLLTMKEVTSNN